MFVILILATTFVRVLLASKVDGRYFHVFNKMLLGRKSASNYLPGRSETECTMRCFRDKRCCVALYDQSTNKCLMDFSDPCNFRPTTSKGTTVLLTEMPCELPPIVPNATFIVNKSVSPGNVQIKYTCDDIFVSGDPVRECIKGRVWSGNAPTCGKCPDDWHFNGTSCYRIFRSPTKNWSDAKKECKRKHSKFVEIETTEENDFVRQLAMNSDKEAGTGIFPRFWLGGTRIGTSYWYWATSGEKIIYFDWGPEEPSNYGNEVVMNMITTGYWWNNAKSHLKSPYICEIVIRKLNLLNV